MKIPEVKGLIIDSSIKREAVICKYSPAKSYQDVINILSDQTDDEHKIYQDGRVKTIATGRFFDFFFSSFMRLNYHYYHKKYRSNIYTNIGIFDCIKKTWSIYTDKPNPTQPVLVIPLQLHDESTVSAM